MMDNRDESELMEREANRELPIDRMAREKDPMRNPEFRMTGLCHAMGFCMISCAITFQMGVNALDMGHDMLGYGLASMSSISLFVLMAGWRSYDLSNGTKDSMGVLFLAYEEGREIIARLVTGVLSLLTMLGVAVNGLMMLSPLILISTIMTIEADKFIVRASHQASEEQTRDGNES